MALSFAFDPSKGETPQTIAQRRQMSNLIAARMLGTAPKNVGEGLNAIGQALIARSMMGDADAAQKAGEASLPDFLKAQITGQPVTPSVATPPAVAAAPMGGTSIPAGEIDPRLKDAINNVASTRDVDPAYMTRLALVENGGKVEGGSPLSSAQGPFQFLKGTAQQYGLANPNDPTASADAAARFTMDNRAALTKALGREPTPGELYLAHQQGAGGAIKLLQNPDAPVESVIGAAAARNNAAAPGMTAGQFANKWTGKFGDIVQTVDPNQKNIIDAQADMPIAAPTAVAGAAPAPVADDSGVVLPPNAQPTGGALPTAQAVQAASAPRSQSYGGPFANVSTQDLKMAAFNPWLKASSPAAAAAISAEITRRATMDQKANDPAAQVALENAKLQGLKLQADLKDKKTVVVNGRLVDSQTGEVIKDYSDVGKTPEGYKTVRDGNGDVIAVQPLPGSEADTKNKATQQKLEQQKQAQDRYGDIVTQDIDRAIKGIDSSSLPVTGAIGSLTSNIPGTQSHDVAALLSTIKANIGFDRLQQMRASSPTGGALGQVSDFENKLLQATIGNLEQSQSKAQLKQNLNRVYNTYMDIIHGPGNGPARRPLTEPTSTPSNVQAPQPGFVKGGYRFKGGNPADQSSWEKV